MLGCTGTGCFFMGIIVGLILAGVLGLFIFFQFNPDIRDSTFSTVRQIWTAVKGGVDNTLDTSEKPGTKPPPEPQIPQGKPAPGAVTAPAPRPAIPPAAPPQSGGVQPPPRARIEINL